MKKKVNNNKKNKYINIIIFIKALAAILGIILAIKQMFNSSVLLLTVCFVTSCFYNYYLDDDIKSVHDLNMLTDLISYGIFPAIIIYKTSNILITNIIVPVYMVASLIKLSSYNLLNEKKEEEKDYYIGIPTVSIALTLPIIYMTTFINYKVYNYLAVILLLIHSILYISKIKIKKISTKSVLEYLSKTRYPLIIRIISNYLLFPIFLIFISDLFFKTNSFAGFALFDIFKSIVHYPIAFILVVVFASLITLTFTCIFKNTRRAKFAIVLIVAIFLMINDIKYIIMSRPVVLSDINFLNGENMEMSALFISTVKGLWVVKVLIKFILMILFGVMTLKSNLTLIEFKNKTKRVLIGLLSVVLFVLSIVITNKYSIFMVTKTYNTPIDKVYKIEDYGELYYEQGLFQGILFNTYSSKPFKPDSYNKEEVKDAIENTKLEEEDWGKPNIVIILSESFFDVANLDEIKFNKDLTENLHKFENMNNVIVTDTYVSTFGGSSVVSEWEILTGASNQFNTVAYIPYTDYYLKKNKDNVKNSPHIIKSLNKAGYITKYITPWGEESYNSKEVFNMVGVDEATYGLDGDKKGIWLADYEINNSIISELSKNKDKPKLLIYATAQNHMPCSYDRYDHYDINVTSSTLNSDDTKLIKCYAQGVYDADKELGNLYNEIQKIDDNTIVIFFGDHLPFINNKKGKNSIKNSTYLNDKNEYINNLHNYTTRSVIFSNYIDELDQSINYINLNYLGAYVYSHLDIQNRKYYSYVNNVRKELPVFSRQFVYDPNNDKVTKINNLDKDKKELLDEFRNVQYYEFFDKN